MGRYGRNGENRGGQRKEGRGPWTLLLSRPSPSGQTGEQHLYCVFLGEDFEDGDVE